MLIAHLLRDAGAVSGDERQILRQAVVQVPRHSPALGQRGARASLARTRRSAVAAAARRSANAITRSPSPAPTRPGEADIVTR